MSGTTPRTEGTPRTPAPYGQTFTPQRLRLILGEISEQIPRAKEGDLAERVRKHLDGLAQERDELQRKVEDLEEHLDTAKGASTRWRELYQSVAKDRDRWFHCFIWHLILDVVVLVVWGLGVGR